MFSFCAQRSSPGPRCSGAMSAPSDHDSDNSSCACSMCCGRGDWADQAEREDEVDAHINAIEEENRRLIVQMHWLQDMLVGMREDLVRAREDLERAQEHQRISRDDLARAREDLARARNSHHASPPHAKWLKSLWWGLVTEGPERPLPFDASEIMPCAWHDARLEGYHNVVDLSCVVGSHNQVVTEHSLLSLFAHLEVTLFRNDRCDWWPLQNIMSRVFRAGQIIILNGKPKGNKWIQVTCVACGKSVFVEYEMAGSSAHATPDSNERRRRLFSFFFGALLSVT